MYIIENEFLRVEVKEIGAELCAVFDKELNKDRMWNANPEVWGRVSPVLFPIVGKVKNDFYLYEGKRYDISQHGFLRDQEFTLKSKTSDSLILTFTSNEELFKVYPFKHEVEIEYKIKDSTLKVRWTIKNLQDSDMYYSIGAHPGFILDETKDYEFVFPKESTSNQYDLKEGLLGDSYPVELKPLDIEAKLFEVDAVIYDDVSSVVLQAKDKSEFIKMNFAGFPFLGLWSIYNKEGKVPFVCIEPWHGIVSEYDSDHDFTKKLGIRHLEPLKEETLEYEMIFNEK